MTYCILAKLFGSGVGTYFYFSKFNYNPYIQAFLFGILPIWLEVGISFITKVEPARETRMMMKITDNIVDGVVFLVIPALWFYAQSNVSWPLIIFVVSGIFRLVKFVVRGLSNGQYFVGLPVTYTGYVWVLLILLAPFSFYWVPLIILSWAMNTRFIKIKAPNYEST